MSLQTVLILADKKDNFSELKKVLESKYFILFTTSAEEAAQFIGTHPHLVSAVCVSYELGLTNASSTETSLCAQFLRTLREDKNSSRVPVIVAAKQHSEKAEREAMDNGASDFIHEPYDEQIILKRIQNLIELHEAAATVTSVGRDELTGLYTKKYFLVQVDKILKRNSGKQYDFVCVDIERLKLVSDVCGAEVAEQIVKFISKEIIEEAQKYNGIVSRFDENIFFAFIERPPAYNDSVFSSFLKKANDIPQTREFNLNIRLLFGVYQIKEEKKSLEVMCERAQMASDKIKNDYNKVVCIYNDSLLEEKISNQKIAQNMEAALQNNDFIVYYQPKYNLETSEVVGAEALVRWQSSDMGFLPPNRFIPLFKKNGFITKLDMFVYEKVCKDLQEWISAGNKPFSVSVNLFRADLFNQNLVTALVEIAQRYDVPQKYLHIEIAESGYSQEHEQMAKVVYELRKNGFAIELDDFGSEYSSLNMLSEMPVDILKLDMDFVRNELDRTNGKGILSYVISLAKQIGIAVIAKGVETKQQAERLKELDCNYIQGFYFSKPLTREEFFSLLKQSNVSEIGSAKSTEETSQTAGNGGTMLIVDDVESSRVILSQMFKDRYNIALAASGEEAWEYIQENYNYISIIILDLMMPGMDGFEVLKLIRENPKTKALPVMVTSPADSENELKALEMDADDFLSKPFKATIMRHRVQNVVAHSLVQKLEQEKALTKKILEIERQAHSDFLTGLNNRTVLEKSVGEFFGRSKNYDSVFISLDIDDFKVVNDRFGHLAGDETIKKVANILRAFFDKRCCVCRMGGDEFAVFVPYKYSSEALDTMLKKLCASLQFNVENVKVTCSIGVATAPNFGMDYQTLYNNSDMALLAAKRYGKNQFNIFSGQSVLPSYVFYRNMDWLLDEFSDAVFVCYADTYDLIYLNKLACRIADKQKKDCVGKKCYEVFYNRTSPCEFCFKREEIMNDFVQKNIFPKDDKNICYTMRAKVVNWNGIDARIQYLRESSLNTNLLQNVEMSKTETFTELDNFPLGFCKVEKNAPFRIISKNKILSEMLGYDEAEFKRKFDDCFANFVFPADKKRIFDEIQDLSSDQECFMLKFRAESVDENLRQIKAICRVVGEGEEKYIYMNLIAVDFEQSFESENL